MVPCHSCGDCKTAGSCRALVSVDGVLRQSGRGYSSRSVSAKDLDQYALCPAQWLLNSELHLPSDDEGGDGSGRGVPGRVRRVVFRPWRTPARGTEPPGMCVARRRAKRQSRTTLRWPVRGVVAVRPLMN